MGRSGLRPAGPLSTCWQTPFLLSSKRVKAWSVGRSSDSSLKSSRRRGGKAEEGARLAAAGWGGGSENAAGSAKGAGSDPPVGLSIGDRWVGGVTLGGDSATLGAAAGGRASALSSGHAGAAPASSGVCCGVCGGVRCGVGNCDVCRAGRGCDPIRVGTSCGEAYDEKAEDA